jgi:hypothetical protein
MLLLWKGANTVWLLSMKQDMQHPCWDGEHIPVVIVSAVLWLLYAVGFPAIMAIVIARDRLAAVHPQDDTDPSDNTPSGGRSRPTGYWQATRPMIEKFWFPLVSHLQVRPPWCYSARPRAR